MYKECVFAEIKLAKIISKYPYGGFYTHLFRI